MKYVYLLLCFAVIDVPLTARDIDLDRIYLDPGSTVYKRITSAKTAIYSDISSLFVDSSVIYTGWTGGDEIVYIKEFSSINIVYSYNKAQHARTEITRFEGSVTAAAMSKYGNTLVVKNLFYNDESEFESDIIIIDLIKKTVNEIPSKSILLDFTLHPSGDSIIYNGSGGMVRFNPASDGETLLIPAARYTDLLSAGVSVTLHVSPDGKHSLVLSGGGGSYRGRLITASGSADIAGISSSSDLSWIDDSHFVYRSGSGGGYSVRVYDVPSGRSSELISGTMNPDINFSPVPGIISCLDNQLITVFPRGLHTRIDTGIEGENVCFAPDGRKFTSIYLGRLYINSMGMIEKYRIEIQRNAGVLLSLYRQAKASKQIWQNNYSAVYFDKKIRRYEKATKGVTTVNR